MAKEPAGKSGLYDFLVHFSEPVPSWVRSTVLLSVIAVLGAVVLVCLYVVAQSAIGGRTVTFWPPSVGERTNPILTNCDHFIQQLNDHRADASSRFNSLMADLKDQQEKLDAHYEEATKLITANDAIKYAQGLNVEVRADAEKSKLTDQFNALTDEWKNIEKSIQDETTRTRGECNIPQ
jgi:hypothetical protein